MTIPSSPRMVYGWANLCPRETQAVMLARSIAYSVLFFLVTAVMAIVLSPVMLFGERATLRVAKLWTATLVALHRVVVGCPDVYRGFDALPEGGLIIAAKHQSTWETLALVPKLAAPAFILKRELTWIPLFGWWLRAAGNIAIDRDKGTSTLLKMTEQARKAVADGRQIIIFPEGTRREAGAPPDYKSGTAMLYRALGVPMVPIAVNSGSVWPRKSFVHRRGTIVAEALPAIPPGLAARRALADLQTAIETACDRLLVEAEARGDDLPDAARARVVALASDAVTPPAS